MANRLEKEEATPETREKFKREITLRIISEGVPEILKNCEDKEGIDDRDVAQAIGWMIYGDKDHRGYKNSDLIGRILGFKNHEDQESFFGHMINIVTRKARELKGTYGEIPVITDEKNEIAGRELFRGERNMLKLLMGEVFKALHKKHLTTEDYDFGKASEGIIKKILDDYKVEKVTDEAGREQFRKEITAVVHKSFTPQALAEYKEKREAKGKKYSPEERDILLQVIDEAIERVCMIIENKKLDADENLGNSEMPIPSKFSDRDIGKVRRVIQSVLSQVLEKHNIGPDGQTSYITDLVPLILDSLKKRPKNPAETTLAKLYEK